MKSLRIASILMLTAGLCASVNHTLQAQSKGPVPQYGRFAQSVEASRAYESPLQDVPAKVEFRSPQGEKHTVFGYWSGGRAWSVNFSPEMKGRWVYRWISNDPDLNRAQGKFTVVANPGKTPLDVHELPKLSADRRRFVHTEGTPWFWLADTAWNGALLADQAEWDEYVRAPR